MEGLASRLVDLQCELVAERKLVNPQEISWLQYDILLQLAKVDDLLPSQLSVVLGLSRVELSKALKGLKSSGYVIQSPSSLDGRELCTSITDSGRGLLAAISAKHTALHQTALQVFTKQEQEEFARLAEKLSLALKAAREQANG